MLSFDANYSIFSGFFLRKCTSSLSGSLCFLLMPITQFLVGFFLTEMYLFPERVHVLSFDANYSIFSVFFTEMYLFPERVLVLSFDANYSIFSGFF